MATSELPSNHSPILSQRAARASMPAPTSDSRLHPAARGSAGRSTCEAYLPPAARGSAGRQARAPLAESGHFRRFHGYDYSRGASLFLSFNVEPKEDILGHIEAPGVLAHNDWGRLVDAQVQVVAARFAPLRVMHHVIMPNHAHIRVYLPSGMEKPLATLGAFVSAFKQSTSLMLRHRGRPGPLWQEKYHDLLCVSAESIKAADSYIDNNPLKRWLLTAPDHPMRVLEPLDSPRLPFDIWWAGVGAVELLSPEAKIASFRLSRTLTEAHYALVIECAKRAVEQGYAIASTFISPCERLLFDALLANPDARIIKAGHKMLGHVYRPTGKEPALFAARRYLLLSRQSELDQSRRAGWLDLNDNIAAIANRAVYARIEASRFRW